MVEERGTAYAVTCQTCHVNVWKGDQLVEQDGQVLLSAYADSVPGTACPSKVADCPHKAAAVAERPKRRAATAGELDELRKRLEKLEPRVKP
jgi:hypothetical protein